MKKILLALCVVLLLASTAVFMYRERCMMLAFARLQPATSSPRRYHLQRANIRCGQLGVVAR